MRHLFVPLLLLVAACFHPPERGSRGLGPSDDDAGDVAFVHAAVQAVLGRPVRGQAELHALVDLTRTRGRDTLLDLLFEEPDYRGHWGRLLVRNFEMEYEASRGYAEFSQCVTAPLALGAPVDEALAEKLARHLAEEPAQSSLDVEWNLQDALVASLVADNLLGLYRVYLLARLSWTEDSGPRRGWVMDNSILHRPDQCIACHNSTWSAADAGTDPELESYGWDRSWPTGLNLDGDVVGGDLAVTVGPDGRTACEAGDVGCEVFRDTCAGCHGADGSRAVASGGVEVAAYRPKVLRDRVPVLERDQLLGTVLDGSGRMPPALADETQYNDAAAVTDWLQDRFGRREDLHDFLSSAAWDGATEAPFGISASCAVFINPEVPVGELATYAGVTTAAPTPYHLADALLSGQRALAAASAVEQATGSDPEVSERRLGGDAALTWLAAESVVDAVFSEVFGERPNTTNGVPRNASQARVRAELTTHFLESGWSLRELLRDMLSSELFNRRAPTDSHSRKPYPLDPVVNPWADTHLTPNTQTGEGRNGTGDLVHRHSPDHLVWATSRALGWSTPPYAPAVPSPAVWGSVTWMGMLGGRLGPLQRGEEVWTTQSLLAWESVVGTCNADGSLGEDWVDHLLAEALSRPDATEQDLLLATRDRLLGSPTLGEAEAAALGERGTPVRKDPRGAEHRTRAWCGALLSSPQYLLGGLPPASTTSPLPRLQVGLPGEPATATSWCAYYAARMAERGEPWVCGPEAGGE